MPQLRSKDRPAAPKGMPAQLARFVASEWASEEELTGPDRGLVAYRLMHQYYRARMEWFVEHAGAERGRPAWDMARADENSGSAGFFELVNNRCRAAELRHEGGQGAIEQFCPVKSCACGPAGRVVAVDRSGPTTRRKP